MAFKPNPGNAATPIGQSLNNLAAAFFSGPTPNELALSNARVRAMDASADHSRAKTNALQGKAKASSDLGALFQTMLTGATPEDTAPSPGFVGPMPQMKRDDYIRSRAGDMYTNGLQAGLNPKDIGQTMFQLHQMSPDVSRDTAMNAFPGVLTETQQRGLAFGDLAPDLQAMSVGPSKEEVVGSLLADSFNGLDYMNDAQQKALGAYVAPTASDRPVSVSPGATLVDPTTGGIVYEAPPKPAKQTLKIIPDGASSTGYRYGDPMDPSVRGAEAPDPKRVGDRHIPGNIATAMNENMAAVRKIEDAESAYASYANASGGGSPSGIVKGLTPDIMLQRVDPEGVNARALAADIGSLKIHDRSGAAVTAAEFPRLRPFIPGQYDDDATILKKLANFKREYLAVLQDQATMFSSEQGYISHPSLSPFLTERAAPAGSSNADEGGAVKWGRDANGNPVRVGN